MKLYRPIIGYKGKDEFECKVVTFLELFESVADVDKYWAKEKKWFKKGTYLMGYETVEVTEMYDGEFYD